MHGESEAAEALVRGGAALPTRHGEFICHVLRTPPLATEVIVLTRGLEVPADGAPYASLDEVVQVRVHSECRTGEAFGSLRCECAPQLERALSALGRERRGILVYLLQEGRGIGLVAKLRAYRLQDRGLDTVEANRELGFAPDLRDYAAAARALRYFGVRRVALLTNNPDKVRALAAGGLEVAARVPIEVAANLANRRYLQTKRDKLGHWISAPDRADEHNGSKTWE